MRSLKPNMIIELHHDKWRDPYPVEHFVDIARILDTEINRPEVREWIEASPMREEQYVQLRHLLMVLRRSKAVKRRRLTLWERITGRLMP